MDPTVQWTWQFSLDGNAVDEPVLAAEQGGHLIWWFQGQEDQFATEDSSRSGDEGYVYNARLQSTTEFDTNDVAEPDNAGSYDYNRFSALPEGFSAPAASQFNRQPSSASMVEEEFKFDDHFAKTVLDRIEEFMRLYNERCEKVKKLESKLEASRTLRVRGSNVLPGTVVVDAKGHILGRLASIVAKELLNGQHVVVVRCEGICLSGGLVKHKLKFLSQGHPMIPHKTKRGVAALDRLMAFEGIPGPYDKMKRMVVPDALKVLRLRPGSKFCELGRLCEEIGWRYYDTIKLSEEKRKAQSKVFYERKKRLLLLAQD
ncbi:hypothetical protein M758_12G077400 [Ceratodon purpureus]|nr:hypothetical protein M758_12G077400 [Ceratodon purpureus]